MLFLQFNTQNFKLLTKMCSHLIRLQGSLIIISNSGGKQDVLHIDSQSGKIVYTTVNVGWVRLGIPNHAQIRLKPVMETCLIGFGKV